MKPKSLQPGDMIGVISPASPTDPEEQQQALQCLSSFGYQVKWRDSLWDCHGYLAGSDQDRAAEINRMFADREVDAIFCIRGGYGTPRILDLIDYRVIRQNPKIFVGYSDITALHLAIQRKVGLVTFHGPMVFELVRYPDPLSWQTLFQTLTNPSFIGRYEACLEESFCIVEGTAKGRLVGGNLSLITATIGTPYEIETEGKILFVEEVGEEPYRIDRMLTQLRLSGKLQRASGIIFTEFTDCESKNKQRSLTIHQILEEIIQPLGIPSYYGLKAGHTKPNNFTLPIGICAKMNATEGWLEFREDAVLL